MSKIALLVILILQSLHAQLVMRRTALAAGGGGGGGITFDVAAPAVANVGTSLSWTHTTGSLTHGVMIVGIVHNVPSATGTCTYNSVSMTNIGYQDMDSGVGRVSLFKLVAPASGSHTVACTVSSSTGVVTGYSATFAGVDQTTVNRTLVSLSNNSTNPSLTVSNAVSGDMVVDIVGTYNAGANITVGAGQTQMLLQDAPAGTDYHAGGSYKAATGSTVMSWTSVSTFWGYIAVALIPG